MKKLSPASLVLTVLLILGTLLSPATAIGGNPVASWNMDDGSGSLTTDSVGGHKGTLYGASWTPAAVVINSSGNLLDLGSDNIGLSWALDFNGKDSYVEIPDALALRSANLSIAFWVSPDASSDWVNVMGKQHYVTGELAGWVISWDAGSPRRMLLHGYTQSHSESFSVGVPVTLGEWAHLVFTVGGGRITAYKNGRPVGVTTSESFLPTTEPFRIGKAYGSSHYFDGLIDNVLFYNTSLTEKEVQSLYESYASAAQRFTVVELGQVSTILDRETAITARLVDQRGSVLAGANVSFHLNGQALGTVTTDSRGLARILYRPLDLGTYSLTAEFAGIGSYNGCAQTVQLVVAQDQTQYALFGVMGAALALGAVVVGRRRRRRRWSEEDLERAIKDLLGVSN